MMPRDPADRAGDAQRVVDALAELFDQQPPRDRSSAEEELRADGAIPRQVGERIARRVAAALPAAGSRTSVRAAGRHKGHAPAAPPRRRRFAAGLVPLAAALATAASAVWFLWPPQREPIAMRGPAPGSVRTLPSRGLDAGLQRPRHSHEAPPVAAQSAPDASATGREAPGAKPPQAASSAAEAGARNDAPAIDAGRANGAARAGHAESMINGAADDAWTLDQNTWQRGIDLLPETVLQRVITGEYAFLVKPMAADRWTDRYPAAFRAASHDNAARYKIGGEDCSLREAESGAIAANFFGFPFPDVDRASPAAGCEIMWNVEAARAQAGGQDAQLTLDILDPKAQERRLALWLRTTPFIGQAVPFENPEALRWAQIAQITSAPGGADGPTYLTKRPNDPGERDKTWTYVPELKRVRSISPANRSDGLYGSDLAPDEFDCFEGKLEDFKWEFVGTKTVLAPATGVGVALRTETSPTRDSVPLRPGHAVFEQSDARGAAWLVVDNLVLVPRPVWVVEGTPRDQYYLYGRILLFVDAVLYRPYWTLSYSRQGELLENTMCAQHWSSNAAGTLAAANATLLTSVNDRQSRATLGRYTSLTLDRGRPDDALYTVGSITARRP